MWKRGNGGGKHWRRAAMVGVGLLLGTTPAAAQETVADGARVSLEYTVSLADETVFDTNVGKAPLVYTHGSGELVPGLERQLVGLKAGDTKSVEVPPEEAYGAVDPNRLQEVPKENVPEASRAVGKKLQGRGPNGRMMHAQVREVKDDTLVVDLNHPLAGQKLFFAVKVLKVEQAPPQTVEMPGEVSRTRP